LRGISLRQLVQRIGQASRRIRADAVLTGYFLQGAHALLERRDIFIVASSRLRRAVQGRGKRFLRGFDHRQLLFLVGRDEAVERPRRAHLGQGRELRSRSSDGVRLHQHARRT
jgi:hypothetical protein